jgi:hypothetical protein
MTSWKWFENSIQVTPYLDVHINLLKSRRAIPLSSGKPDVRF